MPKLRVQESHPHWTCSFWLNGCYMPCMSVQPLDVDQSEALHAMYHFILACKPRWYLAHFVLGPLEVRQANHVSWFARVSKSACSKMSQQGASSQDHKQT